MQGFESAAVKQKKWERKLCRITYSSTLTTSDPKEAEEIINDVLAVALKVNPSLGIGGMMFFNLEISSDHIVQVLEGPKVNVVPLYETIKKDPRHTDVKTLLHESKVKKRRYKEWGMLRSTPADWKIVKEHLPSFMDWTETAMIDDSDSPLSDEKLVRVVYLSTFVGTSAATQEAELRDLAKKCRELNQDKKLGGFMSCELKSLKILQCLEGRESVIRDTLEKIKGDERHVTMKVIHEETILKRYYTPSYSIIWENSKAKKTDKRLYAYLPDHLVSMVKIFNELNPFIEFSQ